MRQMEGDKGERERPAAGDSIFRMADVVGDAWSWLILRDAVLHRIDRFDDFQSRLGIARSTLSARLGQLVTGGLLVRGEGSSYQLTDSGEDMLGCLMVAMRWGDRWHFPPGAPPQVVTHVSCGERFHAVTRCSTCHEILTAHDVTAVQVGPAAVAPSLVAGEKRRAPVLALLERERVCSIAKALTVTGDWWSGLIVRACFFGTRRFDEFQRRLEIAPNILSARLRRLVELEILTKEEDQAWPVRHEYRLTDKGREAPRPPDDAQTAIQKATALCLPQTAAQLSQLTHDPGNVISEDCRKRHRELPLHRPRANLPINRINADGVNSHQNLAVLWPWVFKILILQVFRRAILMQDYCFHSSPHLVRYSTSIS